MATVMALSSATAGALMGATLGALGSLLPEELRLAVATVLSVLAVVIGVLEFSGRRFALPQRSAEMPQNWIDRGVYRWAVLNGATLGAGFTTRIGFTAWYAIPIGVVLIGSASTGAVVYGAYALIRGLGGFLFMIAQAVASRRNVPFPELAVCALGLRPVALRVAAIQMTLMGIGALTVLNA